MTPEELATVRRWKVTAENAARQADASADLLRLAHQEDRAISAGALVSIALSLSVIAEVVTAQLSDDS